jgi:hypothetical protein
VGRSGEDGGDKSGKREYISRINVAAVMNPRDMRLPDGSVRPSKRVGQFYLGFNPNTPRYFGLLPIPKFKPGIHYYMYIRPDDLPQKGPLLIST